MGLSELSDDALARAVKGELGRWYKGADTLRLLSVLRLPYAQFAQPPGFSATLLGHTTALPNVLIASEATSMSSRAGRGGKWPKRRRPFSSTTLLRWDGRGARKITLPSTLTQSNLSGTLFGDGSTSYHRAVAAKGRVLETPKRGTRPRPLNGCARALFNILGFHPRGSFLDLYSGSGAVGLEAASRGWEATCVDVSREAAGVIRKNCAEHQAGRRGCAGRRAPLRAAAPRSVRYRLCRTSLPARLRGDFSADF